MGCSTAGFARITNTGTITQPSSVTVDWQLASSGNFVTPMVRKWNTQVCDHLKHLQHDWRLSPSDAGLTTQEQITSIQRYPSSIQKALATVTHAQKERLSTHSLSPSLKIRCARSNMISFHRPYVCSYSEATLSLSKSEGRNAPPVHCQKHISTLSAIQGTMFLNVLSHCLMTIPELIGGAEIESWVMRV